MCQREVRLRLRLNCVLLWKKKTTGNKLGWERNTYGHNHTEKNSRIDDREEWVP